MIGKVCISVTKYYDRRSQRMGLKERPILVIGSSDSTDFVALPISRVTRSQYLDPDYDYPLELADFPTMKLTAKSYIRTHKQFIANDAEITRVICDFKYDYPAAYTSVLRLAEQFQKNLFERAF